MDKYEVLEKIGKGSFGSVTKVKRKQDGKTFVWKEINYGRMNEKEKYQLVTEVNILRELRHPNIVRYIDRIIDKQQAKIFIVMEYCDGGDIGREIKQFRKDGSYFPEEAIWKIFYQILLALNECHNRAKGKILHRDIKPGNVFLDKHQNVKLGDFGLSRILGQDSVYAYTHVGTPYYMSPEQINESRYNEKSDIWSAGCLIYEITTLHPPFEARTHTELALKIRAGKYDKIPSRYSEDLTGLISCMLNVDHERRPTVEQLLNHPQVAFKFREAKLKGEMYNMKKREEALKEKEDLLKTKETSLLEKETLLKAREEELNRREEELKIREQKLAQNEETKTPLKLDPQAYSIETPVYTPQRRLSSNLELSPGLLKYERYSREQSPYNRDSPRTPYYQRPRTADPPTLINEIKALHEIKNQFKENRTSPSAPNFTRARQPAPVARPPTRDNSAKRQQLRKYA
jgi:serine/threonine protein kinase